MNQPVANSDPTQEASAWALFKGGNPPGQPRQCDQRRHQSREIPEHQKIHRSSLHLRFGGFLPKTAMTCFQGSFRRALFFLEKSRKRLESTFRSTVRCVVTAPPEHPEAAAFGANSQFVLVSAKAAVDSFRVWKGGDRRFAVLQNLFFWCVDSTQRRIGLIIPVWNHHSEPIWRAWASWWRSRSCSGWSPSLSELAAPL